MNMRTVLNGITAVLLVGVFYTFSFCFVKDVEENEISMDYYYSIESTAEAFVGNEDDNKNSDQENGLHNNETEKEKENNLFTVISPLFEAASAVSDMPETLSAALKQYPSFSPASDSSGKSSKNNTANDTNSTDASKTANPANAIDNYDKVKLANEYKEPDDEELLEEDMDDSSDFEGSFEAENQTVYAEDEPVDNGLLSRLDEVDSTVVTVAAEPFSIADVPPVPVADIIIKIDDDNYAYSNNTPQTEITGGSKNTAGETLTAKYNGSVHTVDAYELICSLVNNEISSSFSDEAIKAQAVAAYSYVKYHNANGLTPSVLVKPGAPSKIKNLVSEVLGTACYYNGKVAQTVYMASSSGYTASAVNVWSGGQFPYLVSVACSFDASSDPNYGKTATFSESAVKKALETSLGIKLSGDASNWLKVTSYVDGNYVSGLNVDGQLTITGRKMRETVMGYSLKSAAFDVAYYDGNFIFTTYGYGHGVGMSQNGANILAKQGYTYTEILKYYFTGIEVY